MQTLSELGVRTGGINDFCWDEHNFNPNCPRRDQEELKYLIVVWAPFTIYNFEVCLLVCLLWEKTQK